MSNLRLDVALVDRGLADSRTKAQHLISDGCISVNGRIAAKASAMVDETDILEIIGDQCPYVSRGGLKLEKALKLFSIDPTGFICGDFGASTGGFTDCLLQHGAAKVYAVDVGTDQFAGKLRRDPRVVLMEKMNIRDLPKEPFSEQLDLAVIDVSFISLRLILPIVRDFIKQNGAILCLVKPQFEAGRELIGKRGVIRSPKTHCAVLRSFCEYCATFGLPVQKLTFSPIKGGVGNIEFLALLSDAPQSSAIEIESTVALAHQQL